MIISKNDSRELISLNKTIHGDHKMYEYHMMHLRFVKQYAMLLNRRLCFKIDPKVLSYVAYAHDLMKERSLKSDHDIVWKTNIIPQDTKAYTRLNLPTLEIFGLDDYFNSAMQYHACAAGILIYKLFGITDPNIMYPIFFHSCPILDVYDTLTPKVQNTVDVILLADKLSSNYLKINYRKVKVQIDLDQAVFGSDGRELNYRLGLFLARLISQGEHPDKYSAAATKMYYDRFIQMNPIISKNYSAKRILGGAKIWPERKSQAWMIR